MRGCEATHPPAYQLICARPQGIYGAAVFARVRAGDAHLLGIVRNAARLLWREYYRRSLSTEDVAT